MQHMTIYCCHHWTQMHWSCKQTSSSNTRR